MRKMKTFLLVLVVITLIMTPSFQAAAPLDDSQPKKSEQSGVVSAKDEVVYATLTAAGEKEAIYVVNTLDIDKAGKVIDYGAYSTLKNLTDLSAMKLVEDNVQFTADEGKFYYQGTINDAALPWHLSIAYYLNGKEMAPQELAGKDGHLLIRIKTAANEAANPLFFKNYLLQISLMFNYELTSNIRAEEGTIASIGQNKQVTFTVMPENEGNYVVEADVTDFELNGIEITGVPSSLAIDEPDIDDMKGDMESLTGAISEINDGVTELNKRVTELNDGTVDLQAGSVEYKKGITELSKSSKELLHGSKEIDEALGTINNSFQSPGELDFSELKQVVEGLSNISNGLREAKEGLEALKSNYANAYSALNKAMEAIPSHTITEADIENLYESDADKRIIRQLVETYTNAQIAKKTYAQVKQGFDAVDTTLQAVNGSLDEMAGNIDTMSDELATALKTMDSPAGLTELEEGLMRLASNYKEFHAGLLKYTGGVSQLSSSYVDLHDGIGKLANGTDKLKSGVAELHNGTKRLQESTHDLPEQMTEEIDQMMAEYDKSDFEAVSFVSSKNNNVHSVQFVMKTASIKQETTNTTTEETKEDKGFWARFKELFS
ncbi:YhgE/Pip domain-containing protein [Virgibacillus sp. W0430]|uniref:YhgE/Pip domain-containing protein n=1 Tax=Virgibacillus sp. W0430 TaxID=3391580 RepID=UPI003F485274